MLNFQDRTFCDFHKICSKGSKCENALTDEVQAKAIEWWGAQDAPINVYIDKPKCFNGKEEEG